MGTDHSCSLAKDYPDSMRKQLGSRLPTFSEEEFAALAAAETDFYGMNYYTSQFAKHNAGEASDTDVLGNLEELQSNKEGESVGAESGVHWLRSCPEMFRKHLTRVHGLYKKPIYITENGCPCPGEDKMTKSESINDPFRLQYFKDHLDAIGRSRQDGAVISGYFAWSLMDNLGKKNFFFIFFDKLLTWNRMVRWLWAQIRCDVHRL